MPETPPSSPSEAAERSRVLSEERGAFSWRDDRVFWLLFGLAALLGLIYNFVILRGFGPDEPRHFNYVRLLWDEHRFPFLINGEVGKEYYGAHSLHPPLYYLLLVPFYAVFRFLPAEGVYHVLRLVSAALCLASLPLWYNIAQVADGRKNVARLTVAILGLLPIFGMTMGVVNNDSASILAVAVFLWLLLVNFRAEYSARAVVWLGVALGAGMLCKATVLLADAAALLVYVMAQKNLRSIWLRFLGVGVLGAVIAAPWYFRNFAMYGKFSPIESGFTNPALPKPENGVLVMMLHDNFPMAAAYAKWGNFYSLWSQKDWFPESIRTPIYILLALLCVLAFVGHILEKRRAKTFPEYSEHGMKAARYALYAAFALNWIVCLWMALFVHWGWAEGGRYLIAALGGLAFFLARGWESLSSAKVLSTQDGTSRLLLAWSGFALTLNFIALYWLLTYLNPTFGPQ